MVERYEGQWKDDKFHGRGILIFGEGQWKGDKYEGEFKDDKFNGKGTYTWYSGKIFTGEWREDVRIDETGTWSFSHPKYKTPNAMYVYAGQLEADGKMFDAKVVYNHIIKTFTNSPVAVRATDRLRQIREAATSTQAKAAAAAQAQRTAEETAYHLKQLRREQCVNNCERKYPDPSMRYGLLFTTAYEDCIQSCQ